MEGSLETPKAVSVFEAVGNCARDWPQTRRISLLTWPILVAMLVQSAFTLIDLAFVGALGKIELGALGLGAYLFATALALLVGFSTGVQALSAQATGGNDAAGVDEALQAGVLSAFVGGVVVAVGMLLITVPLFSFLTSDPLVADAASDYFMIRVLGLPALAVNGAFRGYWKGVSKPAVYTRVLMATLGLNILLDWLLIFGKLGFPQLGLIGAAVGFAVANTIGTGVYVATWFVNTRAQRPRLGVSGKALQAMLKRSAPAGAQQLLAVLSFPVLLYIMGMLGTTSLAAGTILINLSFALIILGQGFGFASATLACEAIGAGNHSASRTLSLHTAMLAVLLTATIAAPLIAAPEFVLSLFTSDAGVIATAREPLRLVGIAIPVDAFGMVIMQTMLTAGQGRRVVLVSMAVQWFVATPVSYVLGVVLDYGLIGVWAPQVIGRCVQAAILGRAWFGMPSERLAVSS